MDLIRPSHRIGRTNGVSLFKDTVHDDADFAREALEAGALGYVLKSRITLDLMAAINEAHAGRTFVSPLAPPQAVN